MRINEVVELYYICALEHVPSILEKGILSHNLAHEQGLVKSDFSHPDIQKTLAQKIVPIDWPGGGRKTVHNYVNLYFQPVNPTLSAVREKSNLCILRIRPEALKHRLAVVATANAACKLADFKRALDGLSQLNTQSLYSETWVVPGAPGEENRELGQRRSAELLIPDRLHPSYVGGVILPSQKALGEFRRLFQNEPTIPADVVPEKFFIPIPEAEKKARKIQALANSRFSAVVDFPLPAGSQTPKPAIQKRNTKKKVAPPPQNQRQITSFFKAQK
jgi:hypothetical protein